MTGLINGGRDVGRIHFVYKIEDTKRNIIGGQLSQDIRADNVMIMFDDLNEVYDFTIKMVEFHRACLEDTAKYEKEKLEIHRMFGGSICD